MIPTSDHLRFALLLLKTLAVFTVFLVLSMGVFIISQFNGNVDLPVDCAIVFGAAVHGTGNAGPGITRRVRATSALYHKGDVKKMFLSGGKGDVSQQSEAMVMRKVALLEGVDPEDIVLEERATSTIENILYTKPLTTDCHSIVGVSDRYHLARITFLAHILGWGELQTHPASQRPTLSFEIKSVFREMAALVYSVGLIL